MERIWRGVKWLMGTPWPLYASVLLFTNVVSAIAIMFFVRYLIPMQGTEYLADVANVFGPLAVVYLVVAIILGGTVSYMLFRPVLLYERRPDDFDARSVYRLVLRIPVLQTLVVGVIWLLGIIIATTATALYDGSLALVVAISTLMAGLVTCVLTFVQAERLVRPVAASTLARQHEDSTLEPPIKQRLYMTWFMTSGVPLLGILFLLAAQYYGFFEDTPGELLPSVSALAGTAIFTGMAGTAFAVMNVVDPIKELQQAINRVRRGETNTQVPIYDGSELGVLQAGFNEMMRGLNERERVRDIFGQYVGSEVAQKALEEKPELGGEDRKVAVVFVDVIGSTNFAVNHSPKEVVEALNAFFEIVVDVVHRNKGVINKFQGDAALAVFGAPLAVTDSASHALQAARELRQELRGLELEAGIGVASGHVVAGHVGGQDRFEYTVIGDAVNTAARLTEVAKDTPGRVLTNTSTLKSANEIELARWTVMKSIELRGRNKMTQLARPVRATMADSA